MTTFDRIHKILIRYHGIIPDRITPTASCRDLGLSSLDELGVICDVEEAFGIVVPDSVEFAGVADMIAFIDRSPSHADTDPKRCVAPARKGPDATGSSGECV